MRWPPKRPSISNEPDWKNLVPEYSLVAGVPAEVKRRLRDEEIENLTASAARYVGYKNSYLAAGVQHPLF